MTNVEGTRRFLATGDRDSRCGRRPARAVAEVTWCRLTTFSWTGVGIETLARFAPSSDRLYLRLAVSSRELSRIWNTGRARVVPCTPEGRPLGPALEGDARVLRPGEEAAALEAGLLGLPASSNQLAYVEVRPLGQWTVAGPAP